MRGAVYNRIYLCTYFHFLAATSRTCLRGICLYVRQSRSWQVCKFNPYGNLADAYYPDCVSFCLSAARCILKLNLEMIGTMLLCINLSIKLYCTPATSAIIIITGELETKAPSLFFLNLQQKRLSVTSWKNIHYSRKYICTMQVLRIHVSLLATRRW